MLRPLMVNLTAIGLVIGAFTTIPWFLNAGLPQANLLIVRGLAAILVLGWVVLLLRPVPPRGVGKIAWPFSAPFVVWGGIVTLTSAFWLWMPYADEAVMLACAACQFCTVTVYILTTLEPPPSGGRIQLAPTVLPLSIALFLLVHPVRFSGPLVVFTLAYGLTVTIMQRFVQHAVDDAYAARLSAEIALAQAAAERDAKTRFLASASHDLGQPLQAARLSFDQALRSPEPAQRERAARRVGWAFDTMEQLLRQMLDHLRLESGAVRAQIGQVAVGPLIARIAELHEPAARLAGVDLHVMPSRLQASADAALAERALGNLVVNAIRHAKAGRVLVGARQRAGRVRLWVIDNGVSIAAADRPTLFDDYAQGSNHGDEIRGGFGLGLASARRMADLMGGEVALEAKWLNGSAFWLELPGADAKAG